MSARFNRRTLLGALVFLAAGAGVAHADEVDDEPDEDGDHDRARRALAEGRARPLSEILVLLEGRLGGEMVGVRFKRKGGRYVYELKVVTPSGRLREVYVDAMTASILSSEEE
jgi:uncharacterized membrane protein YkoI